MTAGRLRRDDDDERDEQPVDRLRHALGRADALAAAAHAALAGLPLNDARGRVRAVHLAELALEWVEEAVDAAAPVIAAAEAKAKP